MLRTTLRDLVDNNGVCGFQRRAVPEAVGAHNLNVAAAQAAMEEHGDFDFYQLQQEEDAQKGLFGEKGRRFLLIPLTSLPVIQMMHLLKAIVLSQKLMKVMLRT